MECTHERRRQSGDERVARVGGSAGRAVFIFHPGISPDVTSARKSQQTDRKPSCGRRELGRAFGARTSCRGLPGRLTLLIRAGSRARTSLSVAALRRREIVGRLRIRIAKLADAIRTGCAACATSVNREGGSVNSLSLRESAQHRCNIERELWEGQAVPSKRKCRSQEQAFRRLRQAVPTRL